MIIFATNHDESTAESLKLAQSIIEETDTLLLENNAIRASLLAVLETQTNAPLMVFSHGKASHWLGNDDIPAFIMGDISLLANRKTFVYACWTAAELGKAASAQPNCFYGGYNNAVITGGSAIPNEMKAVFQFIKTRFYALEDEADVVLFLEQLCKLCDETEQMYLKNYPQSLDYIGISTTLRNIWAKLDIWFANQKQAHPEAIEPLLW